MMLPGFTPFKGQQKRIADEFCGVPHKSDRWPIDFLPGIWCEEYADASPAPRTSVVVSNVRSTFRATIGPIPLDRTGLSWVRAQRLAGPEEVRLHLRSLGCGHESFH